jgi:hypothetical protein
MSGRPGSRTLLGLAVAAALLATVLRLGVDAEVLLWSTPALLLLAPLVAGRFPREAAIEARRDRRAMPRRRRRPAAATPPRRAPRSSSLRVRLIAFRLAERGPPASMRSA